MTYFRTEQTMNSWVRKNSFFYIVYTLYFRTLHRTWATLSWIRQWTPGQTVNDACCTLPYPFEPEQKNYIHIFNFKLFDSYTVNVKFTRAVLRRIDLWYRFFILWGQQDHNIRENALKQKTWTVIIDNET